MAAGVVVGALTGDTDVLVLGAGDVVLVVSPCGVAAADVVPDVDESAGVALGPGVVLGAGLVLVLCCDAAPDAGRLVAGEVDLHAGEGPGLDFPEPRADRVSLCVAWGAVAPEWPPILGPPPGCELELLGKIVLPASIAT